MTTKIVTHGGASYDLDVLAVYMDDESREAVHSALAPCDPQQYWDAYAERYPEDAAHAAACAPRQRQCEWGTCSEAATETVERMRPGDVARDDPNGHFCAACAKVARDEVAERVADA
jgi:hypothetical protein